MGVRGTSACRPILEAVKTEHPRPGSGRAWWLALLAVLLLAKWPGLESHRWAAVAVVAGLAMLAKPRGKQWSAWLAVAVALSAFFFPFAGTPSGKRLSSQFDRHLRMMVTAAEGLTENEELRRLFEAGGEATNPARPFDLLDRRVGSHPGRSAYLADDRGMVIAWGGEERAYPHDLRPLGERRLGISWSAAGASLFVREPVLVEGRIVGAVTLSDWTPLAAPSIWGMKGPMGGGLGLGSNVSGGPPVEVTAGSGIRVPVAAVSGRTKTRFVVQWGAWLLLVAASLSWRPGFAWVAVFAGIVAFHVPEQPVPEVGTTLAVLLAGAAIARAGPVLAARWSRLLVITGVAAAAVAVVVDTGTGASPLPVHLLRPGWGGVWMVAVAWAVSGWPGFAKGKSPGLEMKLATAAGLAVLALGLDVARLPLALARSGRPVIEVQLPRDRVDLASELPAPPSECRLDDLAPKLARGWRLDRWRTPSELRLLDATDRELSRWGDLAVAGDSVRILRSWPLARPAAGSRLELFVATEPWSWLHDWRSGSALDDAKNRSLWFAVLTRSGSVAATLHPEIGSLDAVAAGELFHAGGGWIRIPVQGDPALARVWRRGEWLVAAIGRYPAPSAWILKASIACLWALFGLSVAWPPVIRRQQLVTFGGRLRLLVAGGVVLPLLVLTLFLQIRLQREVRRVEEVVGLAALESARYTADQLSGGFAVDDEIARWVSTGWGGEVLLFDGSRIVAASRRDLVSTSVLPELPTASAYQTYLIGRDDPTVVREGGRLVSAGTVELEGRRLLLELVRLDPRLDEATPAAVDWLLTGALLAALLALILTARIEQRLSVSLRDLVQLARRLLHGEPILEVRRPVETDLAEVLDAVRTMNEEVQRRETSLRHQEELLRITLSTLAPAVVVFEAGGGIRFANPSAEHLLAEYGDRLLEAVREVEPNQDVEGLSGPATVMPDPGQEVTWRVGVAHAPLPDGSRGLVAVVDDVTDLVRIDRLRQLNQMARIVAHEVKNPLTPIRLWVQELQEALRRRDPRYEELAADACREISLQVDRLQDTANSFSNLVALEHWQPEIVDLADLVGEIAGGMTIFGRRGINLVPELSEHGGCMARLDRQWMQRAVGNLIKNSVDAIGENRGTIWIRVRRQPEGVVLEVEDTAGGIGQGQLDDLFSPHFSTTSAGSGLGLALVHQVVTRCHGRVSARNGDRGLVVRLELPPIDS